MEESKGEGWGLLRSGASYSVLVSIHFFGTHTL